MNSVLFENLGRSDLMHDPTITMLWREAARNGWWGCADMDKINFLALAEYACRRGQNAGALFTYLIKNRKLDRITAELETIAVKRMRIIRDTKADPANKGRGPL